LDAHGYSYSPWYSYGFNYFPYNFTNPTVGPIFKQLYFRQAFQSLVNQKQYVKAFEDGIGLPTNGPVPTFPPTTSLRARWRPTGKSIRMLPRRRSSC
jgi:peptide/nickel transport system substrate-binding protein